MHFSLLLGLAATAMAACNGHSALCSRSYSNITFMGTHNSAFDGITPFHNQYIPVNEQLDLGVRFLQARTQAKDGEPEMCHTSCLELDMGSLASYLQKIDDWMDKHPHEVVTLLLTNHDAISIEKFDEAFEKTGLKKFVYRPGKRLAKEEWPTLKEMITAGTRLVVFMDFHMDEKKVDYILDEFKYFWETPFGITDKDFPTCAVDRPKKGDPKTLMGMMNHMLNYKVLGITFPNMDSADETNSAESIHAQVDRCVKEHGGLVPNVILLDWINVGEAFDVGRELNGL